MIRVLATLVLLLPASANAKPARTMTLAQAKHLSVSRLAERLLGSAGVSAGYFEADIRGGGAGLMVRQPGLNWIDLFQRPKSAGFAGLCMVEGVHIAFSMSRHDAPGDPPHRVKDFWKFKRFAMLAPSGARIDNADWEREDRQCGALAPVASRSEPAFFAVFSDKAVDAYFAMRALAKAQAIASNLGPALTCASDDKDWRICNNPATAMAEIPIRQTGPADVKRCENLGTWCVTTSWRKSSKDNESPEINLTIRTDATQVDPPIDFKIVAVGMEAGISVDE